MSHNRLIARCVALLLWIPLPALAADPLNQSLAATLAADHAAQAAQAKIDQLDDQTRALFERYRSAVAQTAQMNVYADQLQQLLDRQESEQAALQQQLADIDGTEHDLMPLMLRMLDGLEKFVSLDLPFLSQERHERIESLKRVMADDATPIAEKYRRLLEAYQIEAQYGRTLGAERARIGDKDVDLLHLGRVALFYLTPDGSEAGEWNASTHQWQRLDARWRAAVAQGLQIARESSTPQLLTLPVPAARKSATATTP
jgi:hypothetical protein